MVEQRESPEACDRAADRREHGEPHGPRHARELTGLPSRPTAWVPMVWWMAACTHGMDAAWCYLCHVDGFGVDPQILWGLALDEDLYELAARPGSMDEDLTGYLRFFCAEFGFGFDETFTQQEAATVIIGFLADGATASQLQTIASLSGAGTDDGMTYAEARTKIRRMVALRGLRSA
jgi:hypothetical protein